MRTTAALLLSLAACTGVGGPDVRLQKSWRQDRNGWIQLHLEGSPGEIGYQHGYLAAEEIDEELRMFAHFLKGSTKKDWAFFREAAERIFWPKLEKDYREEIGGIVEGLAARGRNYDRIDITALNGWIELAWYYIPGLADKAKPGSMDNRAPGKCSAFIATGSYTEDGRIVMAHNNWIDYVVGERWNVVLDLLPDRGHRIIMDCLPGFIHSGDDFAINSAGILYTETTISGFKGFDEKGTPEFMRARKAAQYASSIDDFVRIMSAENNGAYANTWLVGDTKTNEIAKFDLGLKHQRVWRTKDGIYVGANFGTDEKLLAEETTFDVKDRTSSPNARKARWEQLAEKFRGKIDAEAAKSFEGDHFDAIQGQKSANRRALCGHGDEDPHGIPEFSWAPFYPAGSVQGKVTTAALAGRMQLWARKGHPCGEDFIASAHFAKHPENRWQAPFLTDMESHPWTLLGPR
jgi:hypothetical protein